MNSIIEDNFNRVVEAHPELLEIDPVMFLKFIIAIAYNIGRRDGVVDAEEIFNEALAKAKAEVNIE